jgi:hypothetical protein
MIVVLVSGAGMLTADKLPPFRCNLTMINETAICSYRDKNHDLATGVCKSNS